MSSTKLYIAGPIGEHERARLCAANFREAGATVVSTWHDKVGKGTAEPALITERKALLDTCLSEIDSADGVYFLSGHGTPRCALVEVGYALAKGKRVAFESAHNIADSHINARVLTWTHARLWLSEAPSGGRKDDSGKLRWGLVPWVSMTAVVRVLMFGAKRYGDDNWMSFPVDELHRRYGDALLRHVLTFLSGETADADTGESHLAHAMCCALYLLARPKT